MQLQTYLNKHLFTYVKKSSGFLFIIILVDLIPLWGVLYRGWAAMDAVYLYFFETLILCFITFLKIRRSNQLIALSHQDKSLVAQAEAYTGGVSQSVSDYAKTGSRLLRFLIAFLFILVNVPLCLFLLMLMLMLEGKGFSLSAVFGYDGGHTDLFVMNVNTFYIMAGLLLAEHLYAYFKKFVQGNEYEYSGALNEAITFELRVLIQSFVMIGGVAVMYFYDLSKAMIIALILIKTIIDVFVYLRNRYWTEMVFFLKQKINYKDNSNAENLK